MYRNNDRNKKENDDYYDINKENYIENMKFENQDNKFVKKISTEINQINTSVNLDQYTKNILNSEYEKDNLIIKERNQKLLEENHKLQTDLAIMELNNRKNSEKIEYFFQENLKLRNIMEKFEEMKIKIDIHEKIDFKSLIKNSKTQDQIISAFLDKIKIIEADYGNEIIELRNIINHLKLQVDQVNNLEESFREKVGNSNDMIKTGNFELLEIRNLLIKSQEENLILKQDIGKLILELDLQNNSLKNIQEEKLVLIEKIKSLEDIKLKSENFSTNNTISNNNNYNTNTVKKKLFDDLKAKFEILKQENFNIKDEIDSEKNKYISLLQMNQDLSNKLIDNMKFLNENKSENLYLKKKVAELQKEKNMEISITNDFELNNELDALEEDKLRLNEMKLKLEKTNQEQNLKIIGLEHTIKERDLKIDNLIKELSLEKMENDNLKEIQKSDIKNISKILTEQSNVNQMKKNEDYINELKISLQNTNKINQELGNQKTNLEKELNEYKNKLKEMQQSFLFMENNKDKDRENPNYFRDDKSNAAFSRVSGVSYMTMTHNKYIDSKIKDLEDSLNQEKNNSEKMVSIKQNLIDKLKKSTDMLTNERNKLYKEVKETKLKLSTLTSEKNTLEENNRFLQEQIKDLNQEICELKLNQEIYDQLEDKLEEYQRQFENLITSNNNPLIQNSQFQQLINENVELNNIKNKFIELEKEIDNKNKEIIILKEKLILMENNIGEIINQNVNDNMMAANNHIKEIEEHLYHADQRIKFLDEENAFLKKNIEDNKLIIFSLREKCKDMIAKEKEVFQLQASIEELKQKKNKRVSFGKDIVVEFQKERPHIEDDKNNYNNNYNNNFQSQYQVQQTQPYYQHGQTHNQYQQGYENTNSINRNMNQRNNFGYNNNLENTYIDQGNNLNINNNIVNDHNLVDAYGNRKITSIMDNNLQELIKSQQSLYEKYSNQLNNIKKVQTPSIFDDIDKLINPINNTNIIINTNSNDISNDTTSNTYNQNMQKKENENNMSNQDTIITQKIKMNISLDNNSMILQNSNKKDEMKGVNTEKSRNSLTNSVNEIAEKYNLSGLTEKTSSQILNDFTFQKKTSSEVKKSMDIFDKILQENAIDLDDVNKNENINDPKENSINKSQNEQEEENIVDPDNVVDSIILEFDVNCKTQSPERKRKEEDENDKDENGIEDIIIQEYKDSENQNEIEDLKDI
jgi:hypothetical protein